MTREIKFRAWDGKRMLEVGSILGVGGSFWENYALNESQIQLMQFTGLKDKNGVEIYEGDLLKKHKSGKEVVEEVHYAGGAFYGLSNLADCEVVGNIYENERGAK